MARPDHPSLAFFRGPTLTQNLGFTFATFSPYTVSCALRRTAGDRRTIEIRNWHSHLDNLIDSTVSEMKVCLDFASRCAARGRGDLEPLLRFHSTCFSVDYPDRWPCHHARSLTRPPHRAHAGEARRSASCASTHGFTGVVLLCAICAALQRRGARSSDAVRA